LSDPVPEVDLNRPSLISDDVQWEIMSRSERTAVDFRGRINAWANAVGEQPLEAVQSDRVVDTHKTDVLCINGSALLTFL
jgi:hypothetical protein